MKNKATPKRSPQKGNPHTNSNQRRILFSDLYEVKTLGKTALEFREEHKIVDIPSLVSQINKQGVKVISSYPTMYKVLDSQGNLRKTAKYWLVEYSPKVPEVKDEE